MVHAQLEP